MTTKPKGPLNGIIVIDLTRILSGPHCTRILSDLGARVIKIEPPSGDPTRSFSSHIPSPYKKEVSSSYFAAVNSGKETITLDLKTSHYDRNILKKLIRKADVLVENFRPGVMKRLGFDWHAVHQVNSKCVMCSISGFGQTGPDSALGAVDTIIQATSGMMSVTSTQANGPPTRSGVSVSDILAGVYAANGIQAALLARERNINGTGAYVDISMLDCSVAASLIPLGQWYATGKNPLPIGNRNPVVSPFDNFKCKMDTRLVIACMKQKDFVKLCELINKKDLIHMTKYKNNNSRVKNSLELSNEIEIGLSSKTANEWLVLLRQNNITCAPVNAPSDVFQSEQVQSRNMGLLSKDKRFVIAGNPLKISGYCDMTVRDNPPLLNESEKSIIQFANEEQEESTGRTRKSTLKSKL
jgi:CoA:oxalate CoA-transferase